MKARSISSSGLAHEQHLDSYPDTEEDYAEDSSDNETEVASNMATPKSIRRKISRTSTAATPTAMSPAGSRPLEEYAQKTSQNINLEYVYDSLRKSLAKGGESSTARTSNAGSPLLMDNAERERMVSVANVTL